MYVSRLTANHTRDSPASPAVLRVLSGPSLPTFLHCVHWEREHCLKETVLRVGEIITERVLFFMGVTLEKKFGGSLFISTIHWSLARSAVQKKKSPLRQKGGCSLSVSVFPGMPSPPSPQTHARCSQSGGVSEPLCRKPTDRLRAWAKGPTFPARGMSFTNSLLLGRYNVCSGVEGKVNLSEKFRNGSLEMGTGGRPRGPYASTYLK